MNKTNHYLVFSSLLILIFFPVSCFTDHVKRCKKMPKQIIGTGEIIHNAYIGYATLDLSSNPNEGQIINSDSLNVFNLVVSFDNRATYIPIDFTKYTLLGREAGAGCVVVFDRNVTKHPEIFKYIYKIRVIHCGDCKRLHSDMNWVLIPKIEDNFSVEFLVEYVKWN